MPGKIYVEQKAMFHADNEEELARLTHAATKAIREGGGAVTDLTEVQTVPEGHPDSGTVIRYVTYMIMKTTLSDIEFMAEALNDNKG